jgi:Flp pilus assembly protein TadB
MSAIVLTGAVIGLAIFLLVVALLPRRVSLARQLAAFDAAQAASDRPGLRTAASGDGQVSRWLGAALAKFCAEQGWELRTLRSSLALVDRSLESYLAQKVLLGVLGLIIVPIALAAAGVAGFSVPIIFPVWGALAFAVVFFLLPDVELRQQVRRRRRDFRHAIGAFLDLVAMNLSGGRGVPEALLAASEIGTGWAMWRIREALVNARITGQTPWQALGALGDEVKLDELRDLAAALSLVAEDGAKVRESLVTRAVSLRRRELAELQGEAGERSQSMLVAQMVLCAAFLVFLIYPAVRVMLGF